MEGQMTKAQIRAACVEAVFDNTGYTQDVIEDKSKLKGGTRADDLGMDDLDIVETIMAIEERLDVGINEEEIRTFGELVAAACKAKGVEA